MFNYYYGAEKIKWADYLLLQSSKNIETAIKDHYSFIKKSMNKFSSTLSSSDEIVNNFLDNRFSETTSSLNEISCNIKEFHSDFNYGISLLITKIEIQEDLLRSIVEKLDLIHETLKHPLLTEAAELREIGLRRFSNGLFDKALEAFLYSERKYDTDFVVQYHIGKLYLFGKDEDIDLIDYDKAKKYFKNAARYANAEIEKLPEVSFKIAESFFYASISSYVHSSEELVQNNAEKAKLLLQEALELSKKAIEVSDNFDQAFYHCAKYNALLKNKFEMLKYLKSAIELDKQYCLKVYTDPDFNVYKSDIDTLIKKMTNELNSICQKNLSKAYDLYNELEMWHDSPFDIRKFNEIIIKCQNLISNNKYLDSNLCLTLLSENQLDYYRKRIQNKKSELKNKEINLFKEAKELISRIENLKINKYISSNEYKSIKNYISHYKAANHNYDSLISSINNITSKVDDLKIIHEKSLSKYRKKSSIFNIAKSVLSGILLVLSHLSALIFAPIGAYYVIVYSDAIEKSYGIIASLYAGPLVIFLSMFLAVILKSFFIPEVWSKFLYIFLLALLSPLGMIILGIAAFLILLIPALIASIAGSSISDDIPSYIAVITMLLIQWGVSLYFYFVTDD